MTDLTTELSKEALDTIKEAARLDGPGRVVLHFRDDKTVIVEGQAIPTTLFPTRYQIVLTRNIRELDTDRNDNDDSNFDG